MKHQAIRALYQNVTTIVGDVAYNAQGEIVEYDQELVNTKQAELQADYDAKEYQRKRATEYPSIGDQLDYIYHHGIDAWKADMVDPVKNKYPKDNT